MQLMLSPCFIPLLAPSTGYTGHIPNSKVRGRSATNRETPPRLPRSLTLLALHVQQDIAGRTYTKTTKRALNKGVWQIVTGGKQHWVSAIVNP